MRKIINIAIVLIGLVFANCVQGAGLWSTLDEFSGGNAKAQDLYGFPGFLKYMSSYYVYDNATYAYRQGKHYVECDSSYRLLFQLGSDNDTVYLFCAEEADLVYPKFDASDISRREFFVGVKTKIKGFNFDEDSIVFGISLFDESGKMITTNNDGREVDWFYSDVRIKDENNLEFSIPVEYNIDDTTYYLTKDVKKFRLNLFSLSCYMLLENDGVEHKTCGHSVYPQYIELPLASDQGDIGYVNQFYIPLQNIDDVWSEYKDLDDVIVAVIDDGVSINHKDLKGRIWSNKKEIAGNGLDDDNNGFIDDLNGWNFIANSSNVSVGYHGTNVAGVIAAIHDNDFGLKAVAPNAIIMPIVVCGERKCSDESIINGIEYAVDNGAQVINLSIAGSENSYNRKFDRIIKYANSKGVIVVIAAGNGSIKSNKTKGVNMTLEPVSPICNDVSSKWDVIGVAGFDSYGFKLPWSNYGKCVDFWSYGEDVFTTPIAGGGYDQMSAVDGTSFASPQVAGIIALGLGVNSSLSTQSVYNALIKSKKNNIIDALSFVKILEETKEVEVIEKKSNSRKFTDLEDDSDLGRAAAKLESKGIIKGNPDGSFAGERSVNRAEAAKMLILAKFGSDFDTSYYAGALDYQSLLKDIDQDQWYASYVNKSIMENIISGYPDGTFRPGNTINTAEFLKMISKAFGLQENLAHNYSDINTNAWYSKHVGIAEKHNMFPSRGNNLKPGDLLSRKDIAIAISNYLGDEEATDQETLTTNSEIVYNALPLSDGVTASVGQANIVMMDFELTSLGEDISLSTITIKGRDNFNLSYISRIELWQKNGEEEALLKTRSGNNIKKWQLSLSSLSDIKINAGETKRFIISMSLADNNNYKGKIDPIEIISIIGKTNSGVSIVDKEVHKGNRDIIIE